MKESKSSSVKAQAIEVWTSIAEEEIYLQEHGQPHQRIIETIFTSLKDVVLKCLEETELSDDIYDTEWGVSTSASCCIRNIAELIGNDIVGPILEYAGDRILETNPPQTIYVGLISLGAIVVGPNPQFLTDKVRAAIDLLLNLL